MIAFQSPTAKSDRPVRSAHRGAYCQPNRLRLKAKEPAERQARVKGGDRGRTMIKRLSRLGLESGQVCRSQEGEW